MTIPENHSALTPHPVVGQTDSPAEAAQTVHTAIRKVYSTPALIIHGDMRSITRAIIGGSFNDGTFTGTVDGEPGFS